MIIIENLTYYYPNATTPALNNINLEIRDGEFILIVGPSGCGKSTLVQCLNGIIPKVTGGDLRGKIRIGEKDISSCKVHQLSRHVGMVFQNPNAQLFGLTVEEDVAFGPENLGMAREEILELVEKSIGIVGIEKLRKRFTFTLSGGEKQRTAIAGAIAMEPEILVLDEPTSDLDPAGTKQVLETVKRLNRDKEITIILIEHKIDEVFDLADRTIVMDRGKIILDGKTSEVFTRNLDLLESMGIYPPQLIRLSKMLKVKPSYKEIYSYFNSLNGSFKEFSEKNHTEKSSPKVVFEDVWFNYHNGTPALKGINLEMKKGEFIALIGSNGSGKTTLLSCLIGFIKPGKGRILIDTQDIKNLGVADLAVKVGYLFQNPDLQLFMNTVAQEVGFGLKNRSLAAADINKNVARALEIMELSEYRDRHPHSLSRGQRQRLAVASIISMEQDILVLDEPTSGQDRGHLNKFLCQIKKLNDAGKTIIMITHDMGIVAEYARRTVVMDEGKILMDGPTREVFSRPDILKRASIEPPLLARISNDIRKAGGNIPVMLTLEELHNKKNKEKVVVSWTGGKDGCFACYKAISEGFDVSHLLNFRDMKKRRSHEINPDLLNAQSEAIGIPIIQIGFESYEQEFKKVIRNLNESGAGIEGAVFGHIETHKDLVDRICNDLGIKLLLPLWKQNSEQIITDFVEAGFEAIIVSAKADLFGKEWLGRKIDKKFVSDLNSYDKAIDPCGENGEFHTFVTDGPMFKNKLRIVNGEKILRDGLWFMDTGEEKLKDHPYTCNSCSSSKYKTSS